MENVDHIRKVIKHMKNPHNPAEISRLPVTSDQQIVAYLRPVLSVPDETTSRDAQWMAEWRNIHRSAFFTWITATEASTRKWLTYHHADNMTDIIFMLETSDRQPLGHLALYNFTKDGTCEFGRVLQNPTQRRKIKGVMTLGSFALLQWATSVLNIKILTLEVFGHNNKAISLYKRLGFELKSEFLMRKININGDTHWKKTQSDFHNNSSKEILTGITMEASSKQLKQAYEKYIVQWTTMDSSCYTDSQSKSDFKN